MKSNGNNKNQHRSVLVAMTVGAQCMRLVATPGVMRSVAPMEFVRALKRHFTGDWGNVCKEDRAANDVAARTGGRILSSYKTEAGVDFWIITEADRSATTALLPEEY